MNSLKRCISVWVLLIVSYGCQHGEENTTASHSYSVETAPEWTDLFNKGSGWFGADGIFAIPVNGNEAPGSANDSDSLVIRWLEKR